jgi:cellulose synthase/poly-beta-1,6-N-acetylglucosamine synthase-like glycosyltransferase
MAVQIKRAGYKIEYEPRAMVNEPSATTLSDQIKQRRRTAIGTLQCMFKHRAYFLLPRDLYSLLIFPSHKGLAMVSPFTLSAIPILYIIVRNSTIIIPHLVATILAFVLMFGILMLLRARLMKPEKRAERTSMPSIFKITYYVLLNEYIILLAWRDFLFGRHSVLWEKAESTR